jgi:hypothetical protein
LYDQNVAFAPSAARLWLITNVNFPRFDRVPKSERDLIKPERGSRWQRFKKPTHANSKRKRLGWSKPAESLSRRLPASWEALIQPFMDGGRNWRSMGKTPFQAKGVKRELERVQQERNILKKLWASFRGNTNKIPVYRTTQARIFRLSSCVACLKFRKVVFLPGESVLSVNVNEKMPNLQKRYNRNLAFIVADTAVHACMWSDVIGDEASHASRLPG